MRSESIRAQARKVMSAEKDRILRIKREAPAHLEKEAIVWEKKEEEEREKQRAMFQSEAKASFDLLEFSSLHIAQKVKKKSIEDTDWRQYKPWKRKKKNKEQIMLNVSTIRGLAKKLISKEWARILGKTQNHDLNNLEREASSLKERKEQEERKKAEMRLARKRQKKILRERLKKRKEEERRRMEEIMKKMSKQKKILQKALYQFGQKLIQEGDAIEPEKAEVLLDEILENVGEIFHVEWHKQECSIWLEPWEEKKIRKISGDTLPVVYKAKIDENLELASYEQVDSENIRLRMREEILSKALQGIFIKDEKKAEEVLERTLYKIGRIINLKRTKKGWDASFEPWEKMRLRNIKNKGKGPVERSKLEINWSEGKFSFASK